MTEEEKLRELLIEKNAMLFLGAGFSYGSSNKFGSTPMGKELKEELYKKFIEKCSLEECYKVEIEGYDLQELCQTIVKSLNKRQDLFEYLKRRFKGIKPADYHFGLTHYPWKRIYTVNIDDLVENIYKNKGLLLTIQNSDKQKQVADNSTEYIKLHGCVNSGIDNLIFTRDDYTALISSNVNFKSNCLVSDIHNENFIFVGASMDERDIDHYISIYEKAGFLSNGKLFFIDPYPTFKADERIKSLNGTLLRWDTEKFLNFITNLDYNPNAQEALKKRLNYAGYFLLDDIIAGIDKSKVYESKLYEGYDCKWEDISNDWVFDRPELQKIYTHLKSITFVEKDCYCCSIYGSSFSGKDCLLKLLGMKLKKDNFHVIEFHGKHFDYNVLLEYIRESKFSKYVLLIENASYYYRLLEKIMQYDLFGKKLIILTTSRMYYHLRKKYYLEGNPFIDYKIDDRITKELAEEIFPKLIQNGYLGNLPRDEKRCIPKLMEKDTIINLFTDLTYGDGFRKNIKRTVSKIMISSQQIKLLYIDLIIFDHADLPYYPSELLTSRYSFKFFGSKYTVAEDESLLDFIKIEKNGVSIKNELLSNKLRDTLNINQKKDSILNILIWISKYVSEKKENYWRIIFESLLKEDKLEIEFGFGIKDVLEIYYRIKDYYSDISFYWLQLGIAEQRLNDYSKALNHLNMALNIRPHAYQIKHAIARNYLKHANYTNDTSLAESLFDIGEKNMKKLIYSEEYVMIKAKPYSIHCYVFEKIKYIQNFDRTISNGEIIELKRLIDEIINERNIGIENLIYKFLQMLRSKDKISVISFTLGDKYSKVYSTVLNESEKFDILIESYE